jgi:hypothetical protein
MSLPELNSNEPREPKNIDFADRNAVEHFLETEKFRPCANLECTPLQLQHEVLYMPVCREGRFNREGVAEFLEMPLPPRRLSPLTYTTIGIWAPLVSCPPNCKGYRNRTLAKIRRAGLLSVRWLFGKNSVNNSGTIQGKRWWEVWWGQSIILVATSVIAGLIIWAITRHYDKPIASTIVATQTVEPEHQAAQPEPKPEETAKTPSPSLQNAKSKKVRAPTIPSRTAPKIEINAPGGIPIVGNQGTVNNPTVNNNYGPPAPKITWEQAPNQPQPIGYARPVVWAKMYLDNPMNNPKFKVVCDRPCIGTNMGGMPMGVTQPYYVNLSENVVIFATDPPNPLPGDRFYFWGVQSKDDFPVHITDVSIVLPLKP